MIKVGIDASRANIKNKTGTEWYTFYIIQELKKILKDKIGYEFIFYSEEPFEEELKKNLPQNFKFKVLKWPPKFLWTQIRLSIEMIFHPVDILFIPAHVIPLIHPKKVILTLHDIGFERMPELYDPKPIGPKNRFVQSLLKIFTKILTLGKYSNNELDYNRWSTRYGLRHAFKIMTVSQFSKKEMIDYFGVDEKKIDFVFNGFNFDESLLDKDEKKIQASLEKYRINKPYLYFVGRLEAKKNIPNLIKAFNILKNKYKIPHQLVLAGKPGFRFDEAEKLISELGLEKDIVLTGYILEEDRVNLLLAAQIFVFPSLYEGFGIPIFEAMAAHVPVACSNAASLPEAGRNAAIYFDPSSPEDIAQTIFKLISDRNLRSTLIEKGLENIKEYSWQKTGQKVATIITSNFS